MKLGRLNHVGVAVPSMQDAIAYYRDVMGATLVTEPFDMPEQGVKVAFVSTPQVGGALGTDGGTQIELIEAIPLPDGSASPIAGFIAKNPAGGQHHLCYEVEDIEAAREWFTSQSGSRAKASVSSARRASARMARRFSSCTPRTCSAS